MAHIQRFKVVYFPTITLVKPAAWVKSIAAGLTPDLIPARNQYAVFQIWLETQINLQLLQSQLFQLDSADFYPTCNVYFKIITHWLGFFPAGLLIGWAVLTFTLIGGPSVGLKSFDGCVLVEVILHSLGTFAHLIRLQARSGLSVRWRLNGLLHLSPFSPLLHLFNLLCKQCLQRPNEPWKHLEISKSDL